MKLVMSPAKHDQLHLFRALRSKCSSADTLNEDYQKETNKTAKLNRGNKISSPPITAQKKDQTEEFT